VKIVNLGNKLRYARERSGLKLEQVSKDTGIGISSLSEFENCKREPRLTNLAHLADLYHLSISFFLSEDTPPQEVMLWRKRPDTSIATDLETRFLRLCEQYHNLEVWLSERNSCNLPVCNYNVSNFDFKEAERLAYDIRQKLGLGDRPGRGLLTVLEEVCGVKILQLDFTPSGTAACCVSPIFGPAVLLNTSNSRRRRDFDLAHELFHLITWNLFRKEKNSTAVAANQKEERLATCFAAHLLMPEEPFRIALGQLSSKGHATVSSLIDVARQFDVSFEALIWRMVFLRYFNDKKAKEFIERFELQRTNEDAGDQEVPQRRPPRFQALAVKALQRGEISLGRFAEFMGIGRLEANRYLEQKDFSDEEIPVVAS
jgi:Zn-dependent peptidase ImmA (M78 family)